MLELLILVLLGCWLAAAIRACLHGKSGCSGCDGCCSSCRKSCHP